MKIVLRNLISTIRNFKAAWIMNFAGITAALSLKERNGWTYRQTAAYGHFGRAGFPWENTDKVDALLAAARKYAD